MFSDPPAALLALVYTDSEAADRTLREVAMHLLDDGWRLAGLVQVNRPRPGRSRCDMVLESLSGGEHVPISEDRGPYARGCALDLGQLMAAMQIVRGALAARPDLVILNKFGKTESEGGGFRPLIAEAIEAGLPLLIAVPWRNIENWRAFAGGLSTEFALDTGEVDPAVLVARLGLRPAEAQLSARSAASVGRTGASPGRSPSRPGASGPGAPDG